MAKKATRKKAAPARPQLGDNVEILSAGEVIESPITDTLETNYMPYAMSVIVSRALPEIDGFKPAHRKLLYTMYGMGLLKGARTKSANIVDLYNRNAQCVVGQNGREGDRQHRRFGGGAVIVGHKIHGILVDIAE